eukprot:649602-Rhodomonas_salina.1
MQREPKLAPSTLVRACIGRADAFRCSILRLPSSLLGRAWPAERVVLGLRACRQLHKELLEHAGNILLVTRADAEIRNDDLVQDFCRTSNLKVTLIWQRRLDSLICCAAHAQMMRTSLVHLELTHNKIGEKEAGELASVLAECRALAHLDLNHTGIGAEEVRLLARSLGECKVLTHLDLNCCGIREAGVRGLGALGECKAMAHLDLGANFLGATGVGTLVEVLGKWKELAFLDLSLNTIGAEGAGKLAGVLGECKALAHLNLESNDILPEGAGRLAGVLGECKMLIHLDLGQNRIGHEGAGRLAGA